MDEREKVAATVARLRDPWQHSEDGCYAAADLLEALDKRLAEVEAERDGFYSDWDAALKIANRAASLMSRMDDDRLAQKARAEAAEAALARLRGGQDAMVGAVIEEAAEKAENVVAYQHGPYVKVGNMVQFSTLVGFEVRALRPDAAAALERVRQEARNAALEEAAKVGDVCQRQNGPLSSKGLNNEYRAGLESAGQAIAAAIRAMKDPAP